MKTPQATSITRAPKTASSEVVPAVSAENVSASEPTLSRDPYDYLKPLGYTWPWDRPRIPGTPRRLVRYTLRKVAHDAVLAAGKALLEVDVEYIKVAKLDYAGPEKQRAVSEEPQIVEEGECIVIPEEAVGEEVPGTPGQDEVDERTLVQIHNVLEGSRTSKGSAVKKRRVE